MHRVVVVLVCLLVVAGARRLPPEDPSDEDDDVSPEGWLAAGHSSPVLFLDREAGGHIESAPVDEDDYSPLQHTELTTGLMNESTEFENITELRLSRGLSNLTRESGESAKMRCEVASGGGGGGVHFRWLKNDAPLEEERGRVEVRRTPSGGSRLRIARLDTHDTGYYTCEATAAGGATRVHSTAILMVKVGRIQPHGSIPNFPPPSPHFPALGGSMPEVEPHQSGSCQLYRGVTCVQYIGNRTVFVRSSLSLMEEKLTAAFTVIATSQDVSEECHKFAIRSLCFFAFPLCDTSVPYALPRQVCRDECEVLESTICRMEYSIAKRHPLLGQQQMLPVCEQLPPIGSRESESCMRLGIPNVVLVDREETCFEGNGEGYRGTVSTTVSGLRCQPWSDQIFYKTADNRELVGGHSYCRNPGGKEPQPWCFTTDPNVRKELCNIPQCVDYLWLYILVPSIALVALLGLVLGLWCVRRPSAKPNKPSSSSSSSSSKPAQLEMKECLLPRAVRATEVAPSAVRLLQELGEGAFGKVYRGELHGRTPVAVKTLKEDATAKTRRDFQREAELMADLHHPNIVCLVGVCVGGPMCMLFEYMSQGDLHEYLITHAPLPHAHCISAAQQVAAGMEYLSAHHYVHRDLAARNCLVGEQLTVKISDFGLSRDVYSSDYYRVQSKSLLPVRWMPVESILFGKFTTESDVWSFGVVLWETFSGGLQPYYGHSNQEVIDMIRSRRLLPPPDNCPPNVYGLMVECWSEIPARRPTFRELHVRLSAWLEKTDGKQPNIMSNPFPQEQQQQTPLRVIPPYHLSDSKISKV